MLWRSKWISLLSIQRNHTKILSIHSLSSHQVRPTNQTHHFSRQNLESAQPFSRNTKLELTPDIVQSTLVNCSSDLICLSFFLWCARQHNYFHEARAVDHMIGVVKRLTVLYGTVRWIVRELGRIGCITKPQTFLLLLRIYWLGGMHLMVLEAYAEMMSLGYVPNCFAHNVLMDVLFKIDRVDRALQVLKENQSPNFLSFNIALCNLCELNELVKVKGVIRDMLKKGFYPNVDTFMKIFSCFCRAGKLSEANQLLGLLITLGIYVSLNFSILIDGFCRLHQPEMACNLLYKEMLEIGCSPTVVTYTPLIKGFMDSQKVSRAVSILNAMESQGHVPDLILCNVLIDCYSKNGRCDYALDVFVKLLKLNLKPDSYTFSSLVHNICLSKRFSLFQKFLSGLVSEAEADLAVCNSLLVYFSKAGLPFCALELYNKMLDSGFTPDKYTFVGLLCGLCRAERIDEAVSIYRGLVLNYPNLDAHVHTVIIDGLIRVGRFQKAIDLFSGAIQNKYPLDVVSYTVAIGGLVKSGRLREAFSLFSCMEDKGLLPNSHTYYVIISGFCKKRDIKMVRQLLEESKRKGIELDIKTLIWVTKFLYRLQPHPTTHNLLIDMSSLKFVPDEARDALLYDILGVEAGERKYMLKDKYSEVSYLFVDSYSSDDLPDVVASSG